MTHRRLDPWRFVAALSCRSRPWCSSISARIPDSRTCCTRRNCRTCAPTGSGFPWGLGCLFFFFPALVAVNNCEIVCTHRLSYLLVDSPKNGKPCTRTCAHSSSMPCPCPRMCLRSWHWIRSALRVCAFARLCLFFPIHLCFEKFAFLFPPRMPRPRWRTWI